MRICVMGLGKLGLPLAALYASAGHDVVGIDPAPASHALSVEPGLTQLLRQSSGNLTRQRKLGEAAGLGEDMFVVVVPTPSTDSGRYDISAVTETVEAIGAHIKGRHHQCCVVIVSTVNPGDTRGPIAKYLNAAAGRDVPLIYSPEFIALGNVIEGMQQPDMMLVGYDGNEPPQAFYEAAFSILKKDTNLRWLPTTDAEIAKIAVNSFVTTKISFANMIADICERTPGADAHKVLHAVGTDSRIGHAYLKPGGPFGGPCFPRDNRALAQYGRSVSAWPKLAETVDDVNSNRRETILELVEYLMDKHKVNVVGVLGLTYKPDTTVTDESLGKYLAYSLSTQLGEHPDDRATVVVHDPLVHYNGSNVQAQGCIGRDRITVLASPDPRWAELDYFDALCVIDVWGVLPESSSRRIHRLGVGHAL
jgi:UDPglucose 6-dehydrogenase